MLNPRQEFDKQIAEIQDHFDNGRLNKTECINILKIHEQDMKDKINVMQQRAIAADKKAKKRAKAKKLKKALKIKKQKVTRVLENSIGTVKQMSTTVFPHSAYRGVRKSISKSKSTLNIAKIYERDDTRHALEPIRIAGIQ